MSTFRVNVSAWGAPRSTEYGAQIRVTVENGGAILEANDAGLAELALEALSLAGPGVLAGTWVEIDEYGGVLAEGSMPVILSRTDSSAGEEMCIRDSSTTWRRLVFLLPTRISVAEISRIMREMRVQGGVASTSWTRTSTSSSSV